MTSAFESREATRWRNFATEEPQVWGEPRRAKPLWALLASGRVRCVWAPGPAFGTESFQSNLVTVPLGDHDLNQEEHRPPCRQTDGLGEPSDLCVSLKTPNIELAAKTHIRTNSLSLPPTPAQPLRPWERSVPGKAGVCPGLSGRTCLVALCPQNEVSVV